MKPKAREGETWALEGTLTFCDSSWPCSLITVDRPTFTVLSSSSTPCAWVETQVVEHMVLIHEEGRVAYVSEHEIAPWRSSPTFSRIGSLPKRKAKAAG